MKKEKSKEKCRIKPGGNVGEKQIQMQENSKAGKKQRREAGKN